MSEPENQRSVGHRVALGTAWIVASRFLVRSLGMISTLVLVRLLRPEDFGLVAIGVTSMQLLTNFSDIGVSQAVVKYREASRSLLDTLFTLSVLRGAVTSLLLFGLAFAAPFLFDAPRAKEVFFGICLVPLVQGLMNPKFHEFERDLDFSKKFRLQTISKLVSVATAVAVALIFRNFWAIIASLALATLVETFLSWAMQPYRPRLTLKATSEQFKFMGWLTGLSFVTALNHKLDALLLPRLTSTAVTGAYYLGYQLVDLFTLEISTPAATALYPGLSEQQDRPDDMKRTFLQGAEILAAIGLPVAFGISFVARDLMLLLGGEKWLLAVPVLQIGAPFEGLLVMMVALQGYAVARNLTKLVFLRELIFFIIRTPLFIWAAWQFGLIGAVAAASAGTFAKWLVNLGVYQQTSGAPWWEPVWQARRSFAGVAVMSLWFWGGKPLVLPLDDLPLILRLIADIVMGAGLYIVTHLALWSAEGRPAGVERVIINLTAMAAARLRRTA